MSTSIRPLLIPGVAVAVVGAVAWGPVLAAPVMVPDPAVQIPTVSIAEIQLAGIGRDIYNSLSATVRGWVQWAEFVIGIVPFVGGPIAAQINLIHTGLIQPLIADTVYAVSNFIADPFSLPSLVGAYLSNVVYTGYTFVTSEIRLFGLPPILGPIPAPPPLASTPGESAPRGTARAAAGSTVGPRAAAVAEAPALAPTSQPESAPAPAKANRSESRRATKPAAHQAPRAAATAGPDTASAKADRGTVSRAGKNVRAERKAVADRTG